MPYLGVFVLAVFVLAMSCVVFGVLLSHVCSEFRPVGCASSFDFLDFRDFSSRCFFSFFFVEFGAADDGIGFRFFLGLFVFGLDETGSERGDLIFVQFKVIAGRFGFIFSRFRHRSGDCVASGGRSFRPSPRFSPRASLSVPPAQASAGAPAASAPASARSQRGNPPENRRETLPPLGAVADRLPVERGVISSTAVCSSRVACSTLGTGGGATAGLPRYFASDSPGRMISSSVTFVTEGTEVRGTSGRRLS